MSARRTVNDQRQGERATAPRGVLWSAHDVAAFLGLGYDAALEMMRLGSIASIPLSDVIPGARSRDLRTTQWHVLAFVAGRFGDSAATMTSYYTAAPANTPQQPESPTHVDY